MYPQPESPPCPKCGGTMQLIYGMNWDYDLWVCPNPIDPDARIKRLCPGEIELETSTMPPD